MCVTSIQSSEISLPPSNIDLGAIIPQSVGKEGRDLELLLTNRFLVSGNIVTTPSIHPYTSASCNPHIESLFSYNMPP